MSASRTAKLIPQLLLALGLVAVLAHVDAFMTTLQPLQELDQSGPDTPDDGAPPPGPVLHYAKISDNQST